MSIKEYKPCKQRKISQRVICTAVRTERVTRGFECGGGRERSSVSVENTKLQAYEGQTVHGIALYLSLNTVKNLKELLKKKSIKKKKKAGEAGSVIIKVSVSIAKDFFFPLFLLVGG